jgi:tetratricopeptide (TPR) repeat protein
MCHKLWGATFLGDPEHGLNDAIKRLREALGDSADNPRFVETLHRRGYRFIAPVETAEQAVSEPRARLQPVWIGALTVVALLVVLVGAWFVFLRPAPALTESDHILLADWVNHTGDPIFEGTLKQGLAVKLEESPFLSIVSDQQVRETLRLMERSPDEPITAEVGQEICQREGIKAMIVGEIAPLGSSYVITLNALNCHSGDSLARELAQATSKEEVLDALDQVASTVRRKLGESLASIEKFDTPLREATTSSLEALQAYSRGGDSFRRGERLEALRFREQAIELDPNFAMAYRGAGLLYWVGGERIKARQYAKKAMSLLERVSEREKLNIRAAYYAYEGDLPKAIEAYELFIQTYPRNSSAHTNLAVKYGRYGQYEKALQGILRSIAMARNPPAVRYGNAGRYFIYLNRLAEAKALLEEAIAKGVEGFGVRRALYWVAFLEGDAAGMQRQVEAAKGKSWEYRMVRLEAAAAAHLGKLREARELYQRAIELAQRRNLKEWAAGAAALAALAQVRFGNLQRAREGVEVALAMTPQTTLPVNLALALAQLGDFNRAEALAESAAKLFPSDTYLNAVTVPRLRAVIEIERGNPARAVELLETAQPFEPRPVGAAYTRGRAYLALGKGEEAAAEFQKALDHPGIVAIVSWRPLCHLGLARARALVGDTAGARRAYQNFLELWKDADPDIPILQEAKAEYAKLR